MSTENGLARIEPPQTHGAMILKDALTQAGEQRALLVRFVKEQMVEGLDYGTIPGAPKPCLYKPGAEKLTNLYRCDTKLDVNREVEDWEKGFFYYRFKARLVSRDSGAVLGIGYGSCNSRESKYRWRESNRKCPSCGKESIIKGKAEFGGGWLCFKKKGGCGAKYGDGDESITAQPQGRVENPDIFDLTNTILKMATKRAHVASALQLAGCSDLFTQDLEDLPEYQASHPPPAVPPVPTGSGEPPAAPAPAPQASQPPAPEKPKEAPKPAATAATKQSPTLRARITRLWNTARAKGTELETFQAWAAQWVGRNVKSTEWTEADVAKLEEAAKPAHPPPPLAPAQKPEGCDHEWDLKGVCGKCGLGEPPEPGSDS